MMRIIFTTTPQGVFTTTPPPPYPKVLSPLVRGGYNAGILHNHPAPSLS